MIRHGTAVLFSFLCLCLFLVLFLEKGYRCGGRAEGVGERKSQASYVVSLEPKEGLRLWTRRSSLDPNQDYVTSLSHLSAHALLVVSSFPLDSFTW